MHYNISFLATTVHRDYYIQHVSHYVVIPSGPYEVLHIVRLSVHLSVPCL